MNWMMSGQKPVVQEIEVVEKLMSEKNLFADANWDDGLTQWETSSSEDGVNVQLYPEFEIHFQRRLSMQCV